MFTTSQSGARFPQIQFEYQDPTANFDRSRVKGPLVRLLRVREREAATALEVTAGGRVSGEREEGGRGEMVLSVRMYNSSSVCVCTCVPVCVCLCACVHVIYSSTMWW